MTPNVPELPPIDVKWLRAEQAKDGRRGYDWPLREILDAWAAHNQPKPDEAERLGWRLWDFVHSIERAWGAFDCNSDVDTFTEAMRSLLPEIRKGWIRIPTKEAIVQWYREFNQHPNVPWSAEMLADSLITFLDSSESNSSPEPQKPAVLVITIPAANQPQTVNEPIPQGMVSSSPPRNLESQGGKPQSFDVEKLSRELQQACTDAKTCGLTGDMANALARHVLSREKAARIAELKWCRWLLSETHNPNVCRAIEDRIAEIEGK